MAHGFFRVASAAPSVKVADCPRNADAILNEIRAAENQKIQFLLFPELAITGATCGDLFFQQTLTSAAEEALARLVAATAKKRLLVCAGFPFAHGDRLYNAVAVFGHGCLYGITAKRTLTDNGASADKRCFAPAPAETHTVTVAGFEIPFGGNLLFDLKTTDGTVTLSVEFADDAAGLNPPSLRAAAAGALLFACPAADEETVGREAFLKKSLTVRSGLTNAAFVYAGCGRGESTGDAVFGGRGMIAENGILLNERESFTDGLCAADVDIQRLKADRRRNVAFSAAVTDDGAVRIRIEMPAAASRKGTELLRRVEPFPFVPADKDKRDSRCRSILRMQAEGLAQRLRQTGVKKAVIGLSGGLDSTLALLVTLNAFDLIGLPRSGIICVTMPGYGTTSRTRNNATGLAEAAGVTLKEIPIHDAVAVHFRDIGHDPQKTDAVYENAQARERTQILMDLANGAGALVIGTGDLSELALGWATYNGDHMSMYGVNAGIPKTLVRDLVRYCAESADGDRPDFAAYLNDVLNTPVSPELLPAKDGEIAQCTESIVGPYELHDFFLYYMLRWGFSPGKIYALACRAFTKENGCMHSSDEISKWLKIFYGRFFRQQFKRSCLPDGPKVGSVSLSPRGGWKMPSDAEASVWLEEIGKIGKSS